MYNYNNPGTNQDCVCLRKNWGLQSKPRLVCLLWGEGERRYMSPNDAEHQSLRPCFRTREQSDIIHAISLPNASGGVCQLLIQNSKFKIHN